MKNNKTRYAVKLPGGFLRGVCDVTGQIESVPYIDGAEWYSSIDLARSVARFALSQLPNGQRFSIYPFKFVR